MSACVPKEGSFPPVGLIPIQLGESSAVADMLISDPETGLEPDERGNWGSYHATKTYMPADLTNKETLLRLAAPMPESGMLTTFEKCKEVVSGRTFLENALDGWRQSRLAWG